MLNEKVEQLENEIQNLQASNVNLRKTVEAQMKVIAEWEAVSKEHIENFDALKKNLEALNEDIQRDQLTLVGFIKELGLHIRETEAKYATSLEGHRLLKAVKTLLKTANVPF